MAAPQPSTIDIITSALRKLGVLGAGHSAPGGEDTQLGLDTFNEIAEHINLRKRGAFFLRNQNFPFGTSKQSYSIGTAANAADFVVAAGDRPVKLELAQVVDTSVTPNITITNGTVMDYLQYIRVINIPALAMQFPLIVAYQATVPNGTIWPYPAFPTMTSYQLSLTWWNQFETVAIADISTPLVLPMGYRRGLPLKLAIALWPSFPKRTDLEELKRQERQIWTDLDSLNVAPPNISSTDGIGTQGGGFDYRSRTWL